MSGKPTGRVLTVNPKLHEILAQRLTDQGWDSRRHFALKSGFPYSAETAARVFQYDPLKGIEPYTLAIAMMYLDYSRDEIKSLLKTYTDDTIILKLMGDGDENELSNNESALVEALRILAERSPAVCSSVAQMVEALATAYNVDVTEQVRRMKRTTTTIAKK